VSPDETENLHLVARLPRPEPWRRSLRLSSQAAPRDPRRLRM